MEYHTDSMTSLPPQLPQGNTSLIGTVSDNFSFHASPEAFITTRILDLHAQNPHLSQHRGILRAKILNRNVAVVSSARLVRKILGDDEDDEGESDGNREVKVSAGKAYRQLMAPFFPPPNLLLADSPHHEPFKEQWKRRVVDSSLLNGDSRSTELVKRITREHIQCNPSGTILDLYESMKDLSWKILLGIFLSLEKEDQAFKEIEELQENLLRGQFSLFPVSVNTRFWKSPRSHGLDARKKLQEIFVAQMRSETARNKCPFAADSPADQDDIANHLLLFTSSLATKAMASLLTATVLNLYTYRGLPDDKTAIERYQSVQPRERESSPVDLLDSVILETGRLSPPVVGVMRTATNDLRLESAVKGHPDTLVPKGWDVWLYFVAAGRDPENYENAIQFRPDRFMAGNSSETTGFEFGWGPKSCLGGLLMRKTVRNVVDVCLEMGVNFDVDTVDKGVRGWVGWEEASPEDWARDMKQLPTQRPQRPINARILY